jgi:hypothetical protein
MLTSGCKDNNQETLKKGIIGKWLVVRSELNNKPSKSMENAYFTFDEDQNVESNVFETPMVPYEVKGQKLTMGKNLPQALEMDISYLENDSMVMEGNYTMYYIKFFMKKDSLTGAEIIE